MNEAKVERRPELDNPEFDHVTLKSVRATREDGEVEMGMTFTWAAKNIGWGEFRVVMDNANGLRCWSEYCGKEFVMKALAFWASQMKIVE